MAPISSIKAGEVVSIKEGSGTTIEQRLIQVKYLVLKTA